MASRLELPWPSRELSPNARGHWAKEARFKKGAREFAHWTAKECGLSRMVRAAPDGYYLDNPPKITITFCPPDKRRRDLDNAIASFKAYQDGIADALGIDDSRWAVSYRWGEPVKGGRVLVELAS